MARRGRDAFARDAVVLLRRPWDRQQFAESPFAFGRGASEGVYPLILDRVSNEAPRQTGLGAKGCGSFDLWLRCSSVTEHCGYAPSSRLARSQNPSQQTVAYPTVSSVQWLRSKWPAARREERGIPRAGAERRTTKRS